jgi:hypothetical protein
MAIAASLSGQNATLWITANQPFGKMGKVFPDQAMAF